VRRLYGLGITNKVMFEAASAMAPVTGWTTIAHVATAIITANKPEYPFGKMPPGGEPAVLEPFPELDIGRERIAGDPDDSELGKDEYAYIASLDPDLARVAARWVDYCLCQGARSTAATRLGPGARELVTIAAACARGEVEFAAQHMRRAYDFGITRVQVIEAVSCVLPMTGAMTLKIGVRAMKLAEAQS
jgi:alkylhydroperoxidase/carboxymuconolactone decarboxylase family protein YurZ